MTRRSHIFEFNSDRRMDCQGVWDSTNLGVIVSVLILVRSVIQLFGRQLDNYHAHLMVTDTQTDIFKFLYSIGLHMPRNPGVSRLLRN